MKTKLLIAAIAGLATTSAIALVSPGQAAPARDPMCKMGQVTGNGYAISQSWADRYHCWGGYTWSSYTPPWPARRRFVGAPGNPMCKMGEVMGNGYAISQSWADFYHCW